MRIRTGCKVEKGLNKASIEIEFESKPNKALRWRRRMSEPIEIGKRKSERIEQSFEGNSDSVSDWVRANLRLSKDLSGIVIDFRLGERVSDGESKALRGKRELVLGF